MVLHTGVHLRKRPVILNENEAGASNIALTVPKGKEMLVSAGAIQTYEPGWMMFVWRHADSDHKMVSELVYFNYDSVREQTDGDGTPLIEGSPAMSEPANDVVVRNDSFMTMPGGVIAEGLLYDEGTLPTPSTPHPIRG